MDRKKIGQQPVDERGNRDYGPSGHDIEPIVIVAMA